MRFARIAVAIGIALVCGCSSLRQMTPRVLVVDPRLEFTMADVAAIDPVSLDSAKRVAARRRPPERDIAEYDLEVELNGSVLSRTLVQITPLPDGLELVRHPHPGPDSNDPPRMESSIGVAGAVNVVYWRGIVGYDRKKPKTAGRILAVEGEPFGFAAGAWTMRVDPLRGSTTYKACKALGTTDASAVYPSFTGRAVRYRCTTDEFGLVEERWFVESLQRYFPAGIVLPDEGEVVNRIIGVRLRPAP